MTWTMHTGGQSLSSGRWILMPKSSRSNVLVSCITDLGSRKSKSRPLTLLGVSRHWREKESGDAGE